MTKEEILECPFGIRMKSCRYQETYAKDLPSAMQGDLVFLCKNIPTQKIVQNLRI